MIAFFVRSSRFNFVNESRRLPSTLLVMMRS